MSKTLLSRVQLSAEISNGFGAVNATQVRKFSLTTERNAIPDQ